MASSQRVVLAVVILSVLISWGNCIKCYNCNSALNPACLDLSKYDNKTLAQLIPVMTCEDHEVPRIDQPQLFCRKITETLYNRNGNNETRVIRGCGLNRSEEDCHHTESINRVQTVCQCFTDNCNY